MLLARYAESLFWMGRYMERAENLARILDVQETFSRDARGGANWKSVVELNADSERFFERHDAATAATVPYFYIIDADNATSIRGSIRAARENARTLRPLISTEMWGHINVFYNWVSKLTPEDIAQSELSRVCQAIKDECQTQAGIVEGTMHRDAGWYFLQLGRHIERADQTTRLLDIKYHQLMPGSDGLGSSLDVAQWNVVLRSAAGYHAYRRLHSRGMDVASIAGFLLFNGAFPRAVRLCVEQVDLLLNQLRSRMMLRGGYYALERNDALRGALSSITIQRVIAYGMHEFLDWVQQMLCNLTYDIGHDFFGLREGERPATPALAAE